MLFIAYSHAVPKDNNQVGHTIHPLTLLITFNPPITYSQLLLLPSAHAGSKLAHQHGEGTACKALHPLAAPLHHLVHHPPVSHAEGHRHERRAALKHRAPMRACTAAKSGHVRAGKAAGVLGALGIPVTSCFDSHGASCLSLANHVALIKCSDAPNVCASLGHVASQLLTHPQQSPPTLG